MYNKMSRLHENINLDMMIDRVMNSYIMTHNEIMTLERLQEVVNLIACVGRSGANIDEYVSKRFQKYFENKKILDELVKIPVIEQKSEEWHRVRQTIITASDFAQALGEGKFGTQNDFLHKKSGYKDIPFDANCPPLKWGCMFEDVASAIYERRNSAKVLPFGLIKHPSVAHFGASPDGITTLGVMVEIKCPFKRKITNEVPNQYYYQIQGQLDVCGLDECDYFECEFKCVPQTSDLVGMPEDVEIGCVLEGSAYTYSPVFVSDSKGIQELDAWIKTNNVGYQKAHIWYLEFANTIRVYKDEPFIERKMEELKGVWGRVEAYRADKDLYDREIGDKSEKALRKMGIQKEKDDKQQQHIKKLAGGSVIMSGYGFMDD